MTHPKEIHLSNIRETQVYNSFCREIYSHTVPLFYELRSEDGGSGILAIYGLLFGILTASHVVVPLKNYNHVWIPYHLRPGTNDIWTRCPLPFSRILSIDDLNLFLEMPVDEIWDEEQLDIAFIQIEKPVFDYLCKCSGKSPIDLSVYAKKFKNTPEKYCSPSHTHDWVWPICGFPREGISISIESCCTNYRYDGVYTGGGITEIRPYSLSKVQKDFQGNDADLVLSRIGPTIDPLPTDFAGASGGGQWQVSLGEINGSVSVVEIFLSGIFVAGSEELKLLCSRGSRSLYEVFCTYLDTVIKG